MIKNKSLRIAIHDSQKGFHLRWVHYLKENGIDHKIVNCYENDIIKQLENCDALMWHYSHIKSKDILMAKQLLFSLEQSNFPVFPNFHTAWHFDDKVGQKYLLESFGAPLVPSYAFYSKNEALSWVQECTFPKVFKLRGGSGSANVKLVNNKHEAIQLINKAFGKGFRQYEPYTNLMERWRKYKNGFTDINEVIKGIFALLQGTRIFKNNWLRKWVYLFSGFYPK